MIPIPKQGMVLAAGLGQRMRPLTDHLPKPLIEVAGRSLVDRAIDRLEEVGVERVVVNTSYKADMLEAHLAKRTHPQLIFSREVTPLETGGGIKQALDHFGDKPFFAANGDVIWLNGATPALLRLAQHWDDGLDALLLLHPVATAIGYDGKGDFHLNTSGWLSRHVGEASAPYVYAGIQLLHPRLFEGSPMGAFSLNRLYDRAMAPTPPKIRGLVHDGTWLHVGDVEGLRLAQQALT